MSRRIIIYQGSPGLRTILAQSLFTIVDSLIIIIMRPKGGYFYFMANPHRTTLYAGVCNNLRSRSWQHKNGEGSQFTKKYNCTDLVYFECFEDIESAILREKQVKTWKRAWKDELIKSVNPEMKDLYDEVEGYD